MHNNGRALELSDEQLLAITSSLRCVFIESAPGSGKTLVAAQRFGFLRYSTPASGTGPVKATSFTRSATHELRNRIYQLWGHHASTFPNSVSTLDNMVGEILEIFLLKGIIHWPNSWTSLSVQDSWKSVTGVHRTNRIPEISLRGRDVVLKVNDVTDIGYHPPARLVFENMNSGICTHEDVRRIVQLAIANVNEAKVELESYLTQFIGNLIVDEVFDANDLDVSIIETAINSGVAVTLIGDPWQALYTFRGARPELMHDILQKYDFHTLPLSQSFRWRRGSKQQILADALRAGHAVTIEEICEKEILRNGVDVVLASTWKRLWDSSDSILPLSFPGSENPAVAAMTLLLDFVSKQAFQRQATNINEALLTLGLPKETYGEALKPLMSEVAQKLKTVPQNQIRDLYDGYLAKLRLTVDVEFPNRRKLKEFQQLRARLVSSRLVQGVTIHQAKGLEWNRVALILDDSEISLLSSGLNQHDESHRRMYVACTRAREETTRLRLSAR